MFWAFVAIVVLLVAVGTSYQLTQTMADAQRFPPPGKLVQIAPGRRLHLDCRGAGTPTVILEAGIAASSLSWSRVQPRVAEFARVCSYDRAGLAWSDPSDPPFTATRMAHQLHALLGAASLPPKYVLVGHSFGGFVVLAYASLFRQEVAGLVLVDPIYPSEWLAMTSQQRFRLRGGVFLSRVGGVLARTGAIRACLNLLARGSTGVPQRVAKLFGSEAAAFLSRMVGEVQKLPPEVWPAVRAHWSQPKCFVSMAGHLGSLTKSAAELSARLGPLGDLPMLVISAESQPVACKAEHAHIASLSSRGQHVVARGTGHWVHLDDAALVVEAIRHVIKQTPA
ncbi:MAG TPA: alpha/beta fold hydrolase [Vicinamibacterales bacterium]|nr:alpha/beta fold hydrolase [Vicinamibacterales bacterium]